MVKGQNPLSYDEIGQRLTLTRVALGLRPVDVCERTGIKPNAYSQWEGGKRRPTLENALGLYEAYGVTLDWLFLGIKAGLPYALAQRITELEAKGIPEPEKPRRGRPRKEAQRPISRRTGTKN